MDSFDYLPDVKITPAGAISKKFLDLGITSFKEACLYVHNMDYGYNSNKDDKMILFKEMKGKERRIVLKAREEAIKLLKANIQ